MLQYTVGGMDKKGGYGTSNARSNIKFLIIVILFLGLIVGWFLAGAEFIKQWHNGTYCNDRFQFPLYGSLLFGYLMFILWFAQFPTRGFESIQTIFG